MVFEKPEKFLAFVLDGQRYGVLVTSVKGINQITEISPLPQSEPFVAGVMNLRGRIIPVLDLRLKLGMEPAKKTRETCIVIVEGSSTQVGLIVDSVSEVLELSPEQINPPPASNGARDGSFLAGVGKLDGQILILLDLAEVLAEEARKKAS